MTYRVQDRFASRDSKRYLWMLLIGACMSFAVPTDWKPARLKPVRRSSLETFLLFVCTCGFYGLYWTYRVHDEHPRRSGDPTGTQALLHMLLPCCVGLPLLAMSRVRPDEARQLEMLPVWWMGMLFTSYANIAYAYIGWRLTGRFYEMWLTRDQETAEKMKEGASSLVIAIGIWVSRNLVAGLEESGVSVPGVFLHPATQAILRGLSIGMAIRWWLTIQQASNEFGPPPEVKATADADQAEAHDLP